MGASTFITGSTGMSAQAAFQSAQESARYMEGHGGYTGTIAEKTEFEMIALPPGLEARDYAQILIDNDDPRIADKWGPAGCIQIDPFNYLFFGWASS